MGEVAPGAAEHPLVGRGRVVELSLDEIGEVRGPLRDPGHDPLGHLVAQGRGLIMGSPDRRVKGEAARHVLSGRCEVGITQRRDRQVH